MSFRLQTYGKALPGWSHTVLGRITSTSKEPAVREDHVLVMERAPRQDDLHGYAAILTTESLGAEQQEDFAQAGIPIVHGLAVLDHVEDGDVVAVSPSGYIRTLYRRASPHNAIFTTDRCNSFCLMCSQPPKPVDDGDRISEHLRLLELIDPSTQEMGITGGEPTLLKDDLLRVIERCKELLPSTALHILSNGRLFYYGFYARKLAEIGHPDLMIGAPLYSDVDSEHDYVVQAAGAFDQTVVGLQNLGRYRVPVEIRIVIHQETYRRLPKLAEFIYRNLPFASHVALMGLEMMGFAVPNRSQLWADPVDYAKELAESTLFLASRGMNVSIYNHQLCVVPREVWSFCRKSISDWKNDYLPMCQKCVERDNCGGFFSSSLLRKYSSYIHPLGL